MKDYREQIVAMIKLVAGVLQTEEGEVIAEYAKDLAEALQSAAEVNDEIRTTLEGALAK